jgi:hypothetical protein
MSEDKTIGGGAPSVVELPDRPTMSRAATANPNPNPSKTVDRHQRTVDSNDETLTNRNHNWTTTAKIGGFFGTHRSASHKFTGRVYNLKGTLQEDERIEIGGAKRSVVDDAEVQEVEDLSPSKRKTSFATRVYDLLESNCVIHPDSWFPKCWEIVVFSLVAYTAVILPLRLAFLMDTVAYTGLDVAVTVLFAFDMVFNFFCGFKKKGKAVTDLSQIFQRYIKQWFWVDLISTIPLYAFSLLPNVQASGLDYLVRFTSFIQMFRLTKFARLSRVQSKLNNLQFTPFLPPGIIRIAQLFVWVGWFAHFAACLWFSMAELSMDLSTSPGTAWTARVTAINFEGKASYYLYSLYWAFT